MTTFLASANTEQTQPSAGASLPPLVYAYVVTYNGKRFLERCFTSLRDRNDYDRCRLHLADNGSSDGSADYVRENFAGVEVVRIFPNAGYAHGANEAMRHARSRGAKYVVIMNDDIEILRSDWLQTAVDLAERDPCIGMIGFTEVTSEHASPPASQPPSADVVTFSGFAVVLPVEMLDRVGFFDEVYFAIGEEDDLAARIRAAGYRVIRLGIPIYHLGGGTNRRFSRGTAYLQMRNAIRFSIKNRSPLHVILRGVRMLDIACNPWPITFDKNDAAHCRMRNSGNVFLNGALWVRAVAWNLLHLPQSLRIRAAERRLVDAARKSK